MTDDDSQYVGADELPASVQRRVEAVDEVCPECGERKIADAPEATDADTDDRFLCFGCGATFGDDLVRSSDPTDIDLKSGNDIPGTFEYERKQRQAEGTDSAMQRAKSETGLSKGQIVQIIGLIFCFTILGSPIGILLLLMGRNMDEKKAEQGSGEDSAGK